MYSTALMIIEKLTGPICNLFMLWPLINIFYYTLHNKTSQKALKWLDAALILLPALFVIIILF